MNKNRMEAFSDGVIAILMTIMVFDLKSPVGNDFAALVSIVPVLLTYMMSFLYLGIYWNNHHHMLHVVKRVNGAAMWANLHLLFWISLLPFVTSWLRTGEFGLLPVAAYGVVLLFAAIAYLILQTVLIRSDGPQSALKIIIGSDLKGKLSAAAYVLGIIVAFFSVAISLVIYVTVALVWLVPDNRIEARIFAETDT